MVVVAGQVGWDFERTDGVSHSATLARALSLARVTRDETY